VRLCLIGLWCGFYSQGCFVVGHVNLRLPRWRWSPHGQTQGKLGLATRECKQEAADCTRANHRGGRPGALDSETTQGASRDAPGPKTNSGFA
jgi:hypothetical protein